MVRAHDLGVAVVALHAHDEALVDLQLVHRQALQVGQRRIAGAEVVDRQLEAALAPARLSVPSARCGSSMIALSVISRQKAVGRHAVARAGWRPACAGSSRSIRSRVDRLIDTRWMPSAPAPRQLARRLLEDPQRQLAHEAGLLGEGDELHRRHQAARAGAASAPAPRRRRSAPVASATLGCRYRRSSSWSTAWRSSDSSDRVCALPLSRLASYSCAPAVLALGHVHRHLGARQQRVGIGAHASGQQAMPRPALRSTRLVVQRQRLLEGRGDACGHAPAPARRRRRAAARRIRRPPSRATRSCGAHHLLQPLAPRLAAAGRRRRSRARR